MARAAEGWEGRTEDEVEQIRQEGRAQYLAWLRFKVLLDLLGAEEPPNLQNLPTPVEEGMEGALRDALEVNDEVTSLYGQPPFGWPLRQEVQEWLTQPVLGPSGEWTTQTAEVERMLLAEEKHLGQRGELVSLWEQVPRAAH